MMKTGKPVRKLLSSLLLVGAIILPVPSFAADFSPAIQRFADEFVIPTYQDLADKAEGMEAAANALCAAADDDRYRAATNHFTALVRAWSQAEVIRFGPVRDKNRLEKLFFWPDARSRGLKQVQRLLASEVDQVQETMNDLSHASVAIQGLPALEYLLLSAEKDKQAAFATESSRCAMVTGIATNIHTLSHAVLSEWQGEDGFAARLEEVGPENPLYRDDAEVLQDILRMPVELLQILEESKIRSSLGKSIERPKGKRAPFWRSDLTLLNFKGNMKGMRRMMAALQLDMYISDKNATLDNSLQFEIRQVSGVFERLSEKKLSWLYLLQDAEGYDQLQYVQFPIKGVRNILSDQYPAALGLQLGFNSLDGD